MGGYLGVAIEDDAQRLLVTGTHRSQVLNRREAA